MTGRAGHADRGEREVPPSPREYAAVARAKLDRAVWDYIAGGSGDEVTLREDRAAYDRYRLRPRVLVDVSHCELSTTLLGRPVALPVGIAPMAYHRLVHADGETATVRAAGAVGALTITSTFASKTLEETARAATGPLWLQVYVFHDRKVTESLVRRAEAAGYRALVITVDTPRMARRERDLRNGFGLPPHVRPANFDDGHRAGLHRARAGGSTLADHAERHHDAAFTWEDLAWLRSLTSLPLVLKGVLTAQDARRAAELGVAGLVVSTHGGRQLDGAIPALDALPEVVEAVPDECEVLVDGGIRRGTDVLKALALGARAVLVGRPVLWGLAADGADGVERVLDTLRAELAEAMALTGRPRLDTIARDLLHRSAPFPYHPASNDKEMA
ncbi:alpha-hydroxy-acid oxidizing protein [Streptomyces piniterrae]|uniref:Alpha-hydroxy-acid oxidizing protein n=1 Tax=Streptomyces piniterrae TaxID=2571125 RepID=A0A4V5MKS8_9ACTN|nr:alpha-hydroxy acid oxidase [Streptomyces piniterrae]TJZ54488.1 alpha-hydroxy-acid oxidizing protein [Streptomyces piniterrae]